MDDINPLSVGRELIAILLAEFAEFEDHKAPTEDERQMAELLFKQFAKTTTKYEFVEENENFMESENIGDKDFLENAAPRDRGFVSIKQKAKIVKIIEDHPHWSLATIKSKYPCYKFKSYYRRWKEQIQHGGSCEEILQEIDREVFKRFVEARTNSDAVHDTDLRRWAFQKAAEFSSFRKNFCASNFWIHSFKKRHRISSRKITKLVHKRNITSEEDILNAAENFRVEILELGAIYDPKCIWNTDQVGFQYEYASNRTLSFTGEKTTFGTAFSPKNRLTHSYTVQYVISAAGEVVGKPLVCLQESSGRLGERVLKGLLETPNLTITCSNSGKLTSTHVKYFLDEVVKPNLHANTLYLLDSWSGHINSDLYRNAFGDDKKCLVKIIPKHCTPHVQPLDVYFNLQHKYFVKQVYSYANLMNMNLTTRNDILKIQSLACFTLSAPIFAPMIRYCWRKSGLINEEREYFENMRDACFKFKTRQCQMMECEDVTFITCSWCRAAICFAHFYNSFHVVNCRSGPHFKSFDNNGTKG